MKDNPQRLAPATPEGDRDAWADGTPVVLWSGATPAAILQYQQQRDMEALKVEQTLALVDGAQAKGPFPLVVNTKLREGQTGPPPDALDPGLLTPADLDGDGVDELVAIRAGGAVEVHAVDGTRSRAGPAAGAYLRAHRARVGAREILLFAIVKAPRGSEPAPPPAVLRVDARGISRVPLAGLPQGAKLLDVGSVARPGAADLDEILAIYDSRDERFLSRHRPDGTSVAPPRKIYVPYPSWQGARLRSLPASGRNVLLDHEESAFVFLDATKPVNWARRVEVSSLGDDVALVGVVDDAAGAKGIVRAGDGLYAVDEEGTWFTLDGARWRAEKRQVPFVRLPKVGPGARLAGVWASGSGGREWLVAITSPRGVRAIGRDDLLAAAERFLQPYELTDLRRRAAGPSLEDPDPLRDHRMAEEKRKRRVDHEITTVEQWRRELPDSYAEIVADDEARLVRDLRVKLTDPDQRRAPGRYRDEAGYTAWLRSVDVPASTTLALLRGGGVAASVTFPAEVARLVESDVGLPAVSFRSGADGFTAVLALQGAGSAEALAAPGLYVVRGR